MTRLEHLQRDALPAGLHIDTYAPGDGVTRYRFFTEPTDYFTGSGIYTALGHKEASVFVAGYALGYHYGSERTFDTFVRPQAEA